MEYELKETVDLVTKSMEMQLNVLNMLRDRIIELECQVEILNQSVNKIGDSK